MLVRFLIQKLKKHHSIVAVSYTHLDVYKRQGVPAAIASLNPLFGRIVITTNQKGIGKGLMTAEDLQNIHHPMLQSIEKAGGKIDQIYYCPDLADDSPNRKPQPGMAFQAKADYPEIDLTRCV